MEKKEPVLTAEREETSSSEVREIKVSERSTEGDVVKSSKKEKKASGRKLSKKTWIIIGVVAFLLILVLLFVLFGKKDEANVAKVGEKSFFERIFGKSEKTEVVAPSFDIVRMEKGEVVIAGRAGANAEVHILDNGKELGKEKADVNGQWVFVPKNALPVGNRKLSLYVLDENGNKVYSKQSAVLHVSKKSEEEVAVLIGETKTGPKSKVLKARSSTNGSVLRVAKIDYDDNGAFVVEGLAKRGATVNVYMNNVLVGSAEADSVGVFKLDTKYEMKAEENTLRADMVNANGKVIARVAYKFVPVMLEKENAMAVVKKGDCLWNIALREYGRGSAYVIIFEANKSQIQDPDKIYVGQVFNVVKKDGEVYNKLAEEAKNDYAAKSKMAGRFVYSKVGAKKRVNHKFTLRDYEASKKASVNAKMVESKKKVETKKAKVREAGSEPVRLIHD